VELVPKGETEGWGVGAFFMALFPVTKFAAFFRLIEEADFLHAIQVEIVSGGITLAGGAKSGEGGAKAARDGFVRVVLDRLEFFKKELAIDITQGFLCR